MTDQTDGLFWEGWHECHDLLNEHESEGDEIIQAIYEEALEEEQPWALDAYNAHKSN